MFHAPRHPEIDQAAFAELFERYKRLVYKTAYLMLGDCLEADEALQEVFVRVYQSLASFDPQKGAFTTWLYRITINYCLGHQRKRQVVTAPLEEARLVHGDEPIEANLVKSAERQEVRQAIMALTEKQRAVIILRYYWDLPYSEIAQVLAIPVGTVKSRLVLALKTLSLKLAGPKTAPRQDALPALECET
ncbi:MAG TPA: RNA polymerase sigma factor [Anaerolineae bacterium]|nr:RNA polymerase sigma factor [Anaerolineae bacterium]